MMKVRVTHKNPNSLVEKVGDSWELVFMRINGQCPFCGSLDMGCLNKNETQIVYQLI